MNEYTWSQQWKVGRKIYGYNSWRETRRCVLFTARAIIHQNNYRDFHKFFNNYKPYPNMLTDRIEFLELLGRVFFYKNSTSKERLEATKEHFSLLEKYLPVDKILALYKEEDYPDPELISKGIVLYENEEKEIVIRLAYCKGQRKEGLMTILVEYQGEKLYNVNCRLGRGFDGEEALIIGTIQGKVDGLADSKKVTKSFFGYRPKNLALYTARLIAEALGVEALYAVSDEGFYANSHLIRFNRSKTVYFDDFWRENEGVLCPEDKRFFRLPIEEARKTYETAKTHKRNLYRKRYELLDEVKESVISALTK